MLNPRRYYLRLRRGPGDDRPAVTVELCGYDGTLRHPTEGLCALGVRGVRTYAAYWASAVRKTDGWPALTGPYAWVYAEVKKARKAQTSRG
jgi:hypothetical protein